MAPQDMYNSFFLNNYKDAPIFLVIRFCIFIALFHSHIFTQNLIIFFVFKFSIKITTKIIIKFNVYNSFDKMSH